ncbi:hypothetical protein PYV00_14300, partial [Novosphingobium sp. H3SJ31-1]|nr:hypothetical protein [Novosphingobium album (ex Liu et al. 2023)]
GAATYRPSKLTPTGLRNRRATGVIGEAGANIVDVAHDRLSLALNPKGAAIDLVVEVQDVGHGGAVLGALERAGFRPVPRASKS